MKQACVPSVLFVAFTALLVTAACSSGSRPSAQYTNVWDQAFAQSMQQPDKAGGL